MCLQYIFFYILPGIAFQIASSVDRLVLHISGKHLEIKILITETLSKIMYFEMHIYLHYAYYALCSAVNVQLSALF